MRPTQVTSRIAPAVAVLALFAAGCGATVPGSPSPAGGSSVTSALDQARGAPSADAVDACALIPEADVQAIIGSNGGGKATTGGNGGSCTWENTDTYYSVTVNVGQTDTAANGTLPPLDPAYGEERPLPDGMRALSVGQVEFVAGTRLCDVQVATNGGDSDQDKAVVLAKAVRDRL